MTVACWENILPFIITAPGQLLNMKACWISQRKVHALPAPIFRDSGMYENRKQIFLRGYATTFNAGRYGGGGGDMMVYLAKN